MKYVCKSSYPQRTMFRKTSKLWPQLSESPHKNRSCQGWIACYCVYCSIYLAFVNIYRAQKPDIYTIHRYRICSYRDRFGFYAEIQIILTSLPTLEKRAVDSPHLYNKFSAFIHLLQNETISSRGIRTHSDY